jgi:hypothetical protein
MYTWYILIKKNLGRTEHAWTLYIGNLTMCGCAVDVNTYVHI